VVGEVAFDDLEDGLVVLENDGRVVVVAVRRVGV